MVKQEIVPSEEVEKLMDEIEAKIEEICESLNRPTGPADGRAWRETHAAELVRIEADHFYSGIWRAITGRSDGWR